jgi:DNA-binding MarR family transcriptional regulator
MKAPRHTDLAAETWELVFELLLAARPKVPAAAAQCGLTAAQCHLLRLLRPGIAASMRSLADRLGCDASNVTGIVDRLEARGLVERRSAGHDRRVKHLALTAAGAAARAQVVERLGAPPEPIARLSSEDQQALCTLLRRALGKP